MVGEEPIVFTTAEIVVSSKGELLNHKEKSVTDNIS